MKKRVLLPLVGPLFMLAGCMHPTKPETFAIAPVLPFNKAMDAVIQKDAFLKEALRPGFYRDADGVTESYTVSPDEEGSQALEHLIVLTKSWCTQNGGNVDTFPEIPVLQHGAGSVVQSIQNRPVVGNAQNMICYRGKKAIAGAAVGRSTYFLSSAQLRQAMTEAGSSIGEMQIR